MADSTPTEDDTSDAKVVVFLRGASHGAVPGQRRTVTPEVAKSLVDRGLARYPKSKR